MSSVHLKPITDQELPAWLERASEAYGNARIRSGEPSEIAKVRSRKEWSGLFPGGRRRDDHLITHIIDGEESVGWLWVGPANEGAGVDWWIWDIYVDETRRGKGIAAAAIQLGERYAREQGVSSMGLNVFGYNATARELYERLDYSTFAVQMRKQLI